MQPSFECTLRPKRKLLCESQRWDENEDEVSSMSIRTVLGLVSPSIAWYCLRAHSHPTGRYNLSVQLLSDLIREQSLQCLL